MTKNRRGSILFVPTSLIIPFLLVACVPLRTPAPTPSSAASPTPPATAVPTVTAAATREPGPTAGVQPPTPTPTTLPPSPPASPAPTATPTCAPLTSTRKYVTPLPPPSTAPPAERIRFPSGATQATVEGYLPADRSKTFVMRAAAGQYVAMDAGVGPTGGGLRFSVVGADGVLVKPMDDAHLQAVFPTTQDYVIELVSDVGPVRYILSILIPVRIRFAPGMASEQVWGSLAADDVDHYVIRGRAGQRMIVDPRATQGSVRLVISGADGQVLLSGRVGPPGSTYDGILPVTQDYLITVRADGEASADYSLRITILR